nr:MAG TPA: hypothetical protein [Caudoviricetes sp.]
MYKKIVILSSSITLLYKLNKVIISILIKVWLQTTSVTIIEFVVIYRRCRRSFLCCKTTFRYIPRCRLIIAKCSPLWNYLREYCKRYLL